MMKHVLPLFVFHKPTAQPRAQQRAVSSKRSFRTCGGRNFQLVFDFLNNDRWAKREGVNLMDDEITSSQSSSINEKIPQRP